MFLYYILIVHLMVLHAEATTSEQLVVTNKMQIPQVIGKLLECLTDGTSINSYFVRGNEYNSVALHSIFASYRSMYLFQSKGNDVLEDHPRFRNVYSMNETHVERLVYPVSSAIVDVSDTMSFLGLLRKMKNSIWWNNDSYFLIVNSNLGTSCQMARMFLSIAWSFNILSAVYLCRNWDDQIMLYAFNPYTNSASELWSEVKTDGALDTSWTLFQVDGEMIYPVLKSSGEVCRRYVFFDKTKNLNGHNLKASMYINKKSYRYNPARKGFNRMDGVGFNIICTALLHVNATVTTKTSAVFGFLNEKDVPQGPLKDVLSGSVDIYLFISFIRDYWKQQALTFHAASLKIISPRKSTNFSERFVKIFTVNLWIFLFLSTFVFIFALKLILKQNMSSAALEFMRIFTNTAVLKEPLNTSARILLILCIVVVFAFNASIQGCLSAVNAANETFSAVDSADDLIKSGIPVYGVPSYKNLIMQKEIRDRFSTMMGVKECGDLIGKGYQIACLYPDFTIRYYIYADEMIHISKGNMLERTYTYTCAEDLPLLPTLNSVLLKMNEGGITKRLFDLDSVYFARPKDKDKEIALKFEELSLIFGILVIGWISGLLLLCAELIIHTMKPHVRQRIVKLPVRMWQKLCKKF